MTALAAGAALIGVAIAPLAVQAALVALVLLGILVVAAAAAHDMRPGAGAALYGGRAVLWVARGLALALVECPVRAAHLGWVRGDVAVRAHRAAAQLGYRLGPDHLQRTEEATTAPGRVPEPVAASATSMVLADPAMPAQHRRADLVGQSRHAA